MGNVDAAGRRLFAPDRSQPGTLALEPRMLFDASLAVVGDAARMQVEPTARVPADRAHGPTERPLSEPRVVSTEHAAPAASHGAVQSLLVVDPSLADWPSVAAGSRVVLLDPAQDGIAQIAQALLQNPSAGELRVVSRAADGVVQLGARTLDAGRLAEFSDRTAGSATLGVERLAVAFNGTADGARFLQTLVDATRQAGDERAVKIVQSAPIATDESRTTDQTSLRTGNVLTGAIGEPGTGSGQADSGPSVIDPATDLVVQGVAAGSVPGGGLSGNVGAAQTGGFGSLSLDADGNYRYTPDPAKTTELVAGQQVTDLFSYAINDKGVTGAGPLSSNNALISFTITGINDAPIANPDTARISRGAVHPAVGNAITGNGVPQQADRDPDSNSGGHDTLTVRGVASGTSGAPLSDGVGTPISGKLGTLTINADGGYSYQLNSTDPQSGVAPQDDVFSYTISDGHGGAATTTLTVSVLPTPAMPVGRDVRLPWTEDTISNFIETDFPLSNPNESTLYSVRIESLPTSGDLQFNQAPVSAGQTIPISQITSLEFVPELDSNRQNSTPPSFMFSVADDLNRFDPQPRTMSFDIEPVNDAPLVPVISRTLDLPSGGAGAQAIIDIPAPTDPDVPADPLTVTVTAVPSGPTGTFTRADGTPLSAGDTLSVPQFQALRYATTESAAGQPVDARGLIDAGTLVYSVSDGNGGITDGGEINISIRSATQAGAPNGPGTDAPNGAVNPSAPPASRPSAPAPIAPGTPSARTVVAESTPLLQTPSGNDAQNAQQQAQLNSPPSETHLSGPYRSTGLLDRADAPGGAGQFVRDAVADAAQRRDFDDLRYRPVKIKSLDRDEINSLPRAPAPTRAVLDDSIEPAARPNAEPAAGRAIKTAADDCAPPAKPGIAKRTSFAVAPARRSESFSEQVNQAAVKRFKPVPRQKLVPRDC